ncbi:hypothetical protein [Anaerotignum sp. MB30-C6]|uniref:hypothetical protein n=1 Tax=Anaerotignum sp. MB30-C6 TaxID=3070814 RepID=UPI0027DC7D22|nr:hypothetical protein [Anaerotignum sp. MB30-C6]WMI81399.1 hypothetical protein RBQ60_01315 [Anaerotignum sp. MB30-C6]
MDFFERIGEVAKNLTEKAGDSLEINRLTGEISLEKGNIQCYQRELGQYFWAKFAVGEKLDDEAMLICDKIVVSQDRMRQLELEIENIKKEREMILEERVKAKVAEVDSNEAQSTEERPQEVIDATASQVIEEKVEEGPKYCANCGGGIKQGQRFCIFCGAEVK